MRKTPKAEQRRRDLCDAAIAVLAAEGARGLTHRGVDRCAGFPEGTTSFYFQTRTALLSAAMDRVIELDVGTSPRRSMQRTTMRSTRCWRRWLHRRCAPP